MTRHANGRSTRIDVGAREWLIDDEPMHLREWGTHRIHPLPPGHEELTIGTAESCALRLVDPSRPASAQGGWSPT